MLNTLAIANYRSINQLVIPLGRLNVITGANGSGKSNLYKALRLLAETARGGVVNALAAEGGLESTFWAGPETISRRMRQGDVPVQGGPRQHVKRLRLGFCRRRFRLRHQPRIARAEPVEVRPRPADQARGDLGWPGVPPCQSAG